MSSDELGDTTENELGLPAWQGIYAGCERLIGLLQLLQAYVATRTTTTVSVPLGMMFPLLDRILTVLAPSHSRSKNVETQVNSAVPREERDALYSMLPKLHIAAIESYSLLLSRAGKSSMSFIYEIFEQVTWFFQRTETTAESRIAIFNLITQVVEMIGPSFTSENCSHISAILRGACRDLRPRKSKEESVSSDGSKVTNPPSHNADSYTAAGNNRLHTTDEISKRHKRSALRLISVSIALLPAGKVAASTRHEMDQIAVLMKSEQALIAGVLNPARSSKGSHTPDLLPFLSRLYPRSLNTEALLRPRIPLIQRKGGTIENDGSESEEMASASGGDDLDFESRPDVIGYQPTTNLSFEQPLVVTSDLTKIVSDGEAMMDHPEERNASVTSPKRARALDISESIQDQITTSSEPISKRLRLDDEVSNELIVPENEAAYAEETAEAISAAKDSPPPMTKSTSRGQQAADSDSDSEGSFVVPPIILDSDTDEDEDEDEEEQDNMALDA
ncbi:MAG: hypothetical protein LQ340_006016 [Diploschistes diacapsis]|nr:MAG: hypothetical protein LQ340_006016 [Diploschistes diacapsis]